MYYYRKHVDVDRLIDVCSRTVSCASLSSHGRNRSHSLCLLPQLHNMPENYKVRVRWLSSALC